VSSNNLPEVPKKTKNRLSRRGFIQGVSVGGGALGTGILEKEAFAKPAAAGGKLVGPGPVPITLTVNGKPHKLTVEPRVTLLDALRDSLDLTGAKPNCNHGTCGTCTVLMDGKAVYACSTLAIEAQGKNILTIESVAPNDTLVNAFVHEDGTQCGFCTPGFVMAAVDFLKRHPNPTEEQIATGFGGNICRCGTYVPVRKAVLEAARHGKGGKNARV
jgi:xanthine dehydrogenase YagT iron-sulfur-binding subunit